jgi:alkanesulfonate monooxygenase SsuD/methylene tetrahydromethanopterin reductase-like flavin-dependent oxidoreductase (luciferase family)
MWSPNDSAYQGRHYQLGRTLDLPTPPKRPFILIGGGGERKTLRLVAQYADACNIGVGEDTPHKLEVLRAHCETVGRDYDEIEKTTTTHIDIKTTQRGLIETLRAAHNAGIAVAYIWARHPEPLSTIELLNAVTDEIGGW